MIIPVHILVFVPPGNGFFGNFDAIFINSADLAIHQPHNFIASYGILVALINNALTIHHVNLNAHCPAYFEISFHTKNNSDQITNAHNPPTAQSFMLKSPFFIFTLDSFKRAHHQTNQFVAIIE